MRHVISFVLIVWALGCSALQTGPCSADGVRVACITAAAAVMADACTDATDIAECDESALALMACTTAAHQACEAAP